MSSGRRLQRPRRGRLRGRSRGQHAGRPCLAAPLLPYLAVALTVTGLTAWTFAGGFGAYRAARAPYATTAAVVRQSHEQGCAAALLATLLARHGLPGTEAELLTASPPGPHGISLAEFAAVARRFGLDGGWRRSHDRSLPAPGFVAHLGRPSGHYVYVEARAGVYLHVLDPAEGAAIWHLDTFLRRWTGRYLRPVPA